MSVREHLESRKSPAIHSGNLRYPSDLTDEEGAVIALLIPAAKKGGNKRTVDVVGVVKCRRRRSSRALTPQRRRRRAPLAEHQQPQGDRALFVRMIGGPMTPTFRGDAAASLSATAG